MLLLHSISSFVSYDSISADWAGKFRASCHILGLRNRTVITVTGRTYERSAERIESYKAIPIVLLLLTDMLISYRAVVLVREEDCAVLVRLSKRNQVPRENGTYRPPMSEQPRHSQRSSLGIYCVHLARDSL